MVIQHNLTAMNSNRMLGITTGMQAKSSEKLSSGYKINRAADDAAGLAISEKMRKQMRGLDRASTNADDGVSSVQTAEGALTEVHDMIQRMNELAIQAANGTNSVSDRESIQMEIAQITTEIDRVSETTKFNETYLLHGGTGFYNKFMSAHDAGLAGELDDLGSSATFSIDIETNEDMRIAGADYHIYSAERSNNNSDLLTSIQQRVSLQTLAFTGGTNSVNSDPLTGSITINGSTYVVGSSSLIGSTPVFKYGEEEFSIDQMKAMIADGTRVAIGSGEARMAVDPKLDKNIQVSTAIDKIKASLIQANKIGVDSDKQGMVKASSNTAINKTTGQPIANLRAEEGRYTFSISKGTAKVAKDLHMALHVGSDADMTNKITVAIEVMSAANLGIQNINVVDSTGISATYAVDAIEDALREVSEQRSKLGAIQNRLEHTIKNLDNVVENTTAAESRIRDTDMADEMVTYSKNNILAQAGQSMLAQANQSTQGVMSLLQG